MTVDDETSPPSQDGQSETEALSDTSSSPEGSPGDPAEDVHPDTPPSTENAVEAVEQTTNSNLRDNAAPAESVPAEGPAGNPVGLDPSAGEPVSGRETASAPALGANWFVSSLQILALWSAAVAAPLLMLLRDQPTYFTAHGVDGSVLIIWVVALIFLVPAAIAMLRWVIRRFSAKADRLVFLAVLAALIFLLWAGFFQSLPTPALVTLALCGLLTVVALVLFSDFAALRRAVTAISALSVILLFLFFSQPGISDLLSAKQVAIEPIAGYTAKNDVVVIVFDELPLVSLLDEAGNVDATMFPNFARLAGTSTWFKNVISVHTETAQAVPAILSGDYPNFSRAPVQATYPQNLFTVFGGNYNVFGFEQLTDLCGTTLCPDASAEDVDLFLEDTGIVYRHLIYPRDWEKNLPSIDRTWSSFAGSPSADPRTSILGEEQIVEGSGVSKFGNRTTRFNEFVSAIKPGDTPSLYFVHSALPHQPWEYDPAGHLYSRAGDIPGLRGLFWLENSDDQVQAAYQRYLMQLQYADRLLGDALDKLDSTGRFDDALITVTADHGAGFESGEGFREYSDGNHAALYRVPVFIKAPRQTSPEVNDSFGQTIDIVPTVADMVGLPWPEADGQSLLGAPIDPKTRTVYTRESEARPVSGLDLDYMADVTRLRSWFQDLDQPLGVYAIGTAKELIGAPITDVATKGSVDIEVDGIEAMRQPDMSTGYAPVSFRGSIPGAEVATPILVSVNGTIIATGQTRIINGDTGAFWLMLPYFHLESGDNDIEVLVGTPGEIRTSWRKGRIEEPVAFETDGDFSPGGVITTSEGEEIVIQDQPAPGQLTFKTEGRIVHIDGWTEAPRGSAVERVIAFDNDELLFQGRALLPGSEVGAPAQRAEDTIGFSHREPLNEWGSRQLADVTVLGVIGNKAWVLERPPCDSATERPAGLVRDCVLYEQKLRLDGTDLPIITARDGSWKVARDEADNQVLITGWAADRSAGSAPDRVVAVRGAEVVDATTTTGDTPEVAEYFNDDALTAVGLEMIVPGDWPDDMSVYAVRNGKAWLLNRDQG